MDISGMTVFVPNPIHEAAVQLLKNHVNTVLWEDPAIGQWRERADAIIVRTYPVRKEDIDRCTRLKVIGKHGIGTDTIDVDDARKANVEVVYTPFENVESVAELAVAFMMALSRNLFNGNSALREGRSLPLADLVGVELGGKTLGIIGLGRIGRRVGTMLRAAFEMEIVAFDPFLPPDAWADMPFPVERMARVEELFERSDYVTVHVPLSEETRGIIGAEQLRHCRPSAILVNTARGGIVDEAALYDALKSKQLRAAGSDVFVDEPPEKSHPLLSLDNFIAMPHVGANTQDALYRMGMTVAQDILRSLRGEKSHYYVP